MSEAFDSRSHGAASCVGCGVDLCDHAAGAGLILCPACFEVQVQIGFANPHLIDPDQTENPPDSDDLHSATCCDYHAAEGLDDVPCQMWKGDHYAPNFEPLNGEDFDSEHDLFKRWIDFKILTEKKHILELLNGWDDCTCPDCGGNVEFETSGAGVEASCWTCGVGCSLDVVFP